MSFAPWHLAKSGEFYFAIDSYGQGQFFTKKPIRVTFTREPFVTYVSWREPASGWSGRYIPMSVRSFRGISSEYAKMSLERKP